ncbi:MAG: hypothetical protein O7F08_09195 [Deltaproteobacteria bacterium]|nr:hypothetical protein [Deltaproteobacteria bacterium]
MRWRLAYRNDPEGRELADRHYNRQSIGAPGFVPPGRCIVLVTECARAVWTTSWPFAEYVKHEWAGAWVNSLFRNEGAGLSSELILEAVAATRYIWPDVPDLGLVTFVDASKVRSSNPGCCYKHAGFTRIGTTKGGLLAFGLSLEDMPEAAPALGQTLDMFSAVLGA